jgi:hypothetical protein
MLITPAYAELNRELHKRIPKYGTSGRKWAETVRLLAAKTRSGSILDYGCGKGTLKGAVGPHVREYDPCIKGKDARPSPCDLVVCTDVMEHVELECVDAVLADVFALANRAVLLGICCREDSKKLADGRGAHITVRPPEWWAEKVGKLGPYEQIPCPDGDFNAVLVKYADND